MRLTKERKLKIRSHEGEARYETRESKRKNSNLHTIFSFFGGGGEGGTGGEGWWHLFLTVFILCRMGEEYSTWNINSI